MGLPFNVQFGEVGKSLKQSVSVLTIHAGSCCLVGGGGVYATSLALVWCGGA